MSMVGENGESRFAAGALLLLAHVMEPDLPSASSSWFVSSSAWSRQLVVERWSGDSLD